MNTRIIISKFTNSVSYNGVCLEDLDLPFPEGVTALYWNGDSGWIENGTNAIYNQDITELPDWANECIAIFQSKIPVPKPITPEEECKEQALMLLQRTDWSEIPSVSDPANTPHLLNLQEFIDYRIAVRELAVNPVANPTFPILPTAQWSN